MQTQWNGARMLSGEPVKAQEVCCWSVRCVKIHSKSAVGGLARKHIHNPNELPTITVGVMRLYLWMEIRG